MAKHVLLRKRIGEARIEVLAENPRMTAGGLVYRELAWRYAYSLGYPQGSPWRITAKGFNPAAINLEGLEEIQVN